MSFLCFLPSCVCPRLSLSVCHFQLDLADLQKELEKSKSVFPENPSVWVKDLAGYLNYKLQAPRSDPVLSQHPHGPCPAATGGDGAVVLCYQSGEDLLFWAVPTIAFSQPQTGKLRIRGCPIHPLSPGIHHLCLLLWSLGVHSQLSPLNARGMLGLGFPFLCDHLVPTHNENVSFWVAGGRRKNYLLQSPVHPPASAFSGKASLRAGLAASDTESLGRRQCCLAAVNMGHSLHPPHTGPVPQLLELSRAGSHHTFPPLLPPQTIRTAWWARS